MVNIPRYKKNEKMKEKRCAFPNCEELFIGTGKAKYCHEHRKRKYRKIIDKNKAKKNNLSLQNVNLTIKHTYSSPTTYRVKCACCDKEFDIVLYPNVYVYPKFCSEHRNEFKRNFYMKLHGMISELPKTVIDLSEPEEPNVDLDLVTEFENEIDD